MTESRLHKIWFCRACLLMLPNTGEKSPSDWTLGDHLWLLTLFPLGEGGQFLT